MASSFRRRLRVASIARKSPPWSVSICHMRGKQARSDSACASPAKMPDTIESIITVAASSPIRRAANAWIVSSSSGRLRANGSHTIRAFPGHESRSLVTKAPGETGTSCSRPLL